MNKISKIEAATELEENIVVELFKRLEEAGLRYALLRNFENFPQFGHDVDLIMHGDDLPRWREIAKAVAEDNDWDVLTECAHWAQSGASFHNIEVFRFYQKSSMAFLQVDIFHSALLWALPLYSEDEMLAERIQNLDHGFTQINPMVEHVNHFFQIQKLLTHSDIIAELFKTEAKTERYRNKVLAYSRESSHGFESVLNSLFSKHGVEALQALEKNEMSAFTQAIKASKRHFFLNFLCHHSIQAVQALFNRLYGKFYAGRFHPCGFLLNVNAENEAEREDLNEALTLLMESNALIAFTVKWAETPKLNKQERCILERGGIVVKWDADAFNEKTLKIGAYENKESLLSALLERLIQRHEALYLRLNN